MVYSFGHVYPRPVTSILEGSTSKSLVISLLVIVSGFIPHAGDFIGIVKHLIPDLVTKSRTSSGVDPSPKGRLKTTP